MLYRRVMAAALLCGSVWGQMATTTTLGSGCDERRASFFERFAPGTFDMAGTQISPGGYSMVSYGESWIVIPLQSQWRMPELDAAPISFDANGLSGPHPLGFQFDFPGGSTSDCWIGAAGFLQFAPDAWDLRGLPPIRQLFYGPPRLAMLWTDLQPQNSGQVSIHREGGVGGCVCITFDSVREINTGYTNTFQVTIHAAGRIDVAYGPCGANSHWMLAGWSPGNRALPTQDIDLSSLALNLLITYPDRDPLVLDTYDRPVLGSQLAFETVHMPNTVKFVFTALGAQGYPLGIDLSALGMSGCNLYASHECGIGAMVNSGAARWTLAVPVDQGIVGVSAYLQSVAFDANANAAGILLSNGLELTVGTF